MLGNLGNLGKIAGIDVGAGSKAQSQEIYMGIIFSRLLLDQVIYHQYEFEEDRELRKQNLVEYFELDDLEQREISEKIVEILNNIVKTEVQKEYRQKLTYLEDRLNGIEDSLVIAEKELMLFLETNTDPTVPAFQVKQLRLQRNLRLQAELLIEFRKQLEIFIADNMVNLADIKVLDQAYPPYRKSRPKRALLLIALTMLVGFVHLGVNVSIVILQKFKNEFNGKLLEKDQTKT
jgi:hypothetical protein